MVTECGLVSRRQFYLARCRWPVHVHASPYATATPFARSTGTLGCAVRAIASPSQASRPASHAAPHCCYGPLSPFVLLAVGSQRASRCQMALHEFLMPNSKKKQPKQRASRGLVLSPQVCLDSLANRTFSRIVSSQKTMQWKGFVLITMNLCSAEEIYVTWMRALNWCDFCWSYYSIKH